MALRDLVVGSTVFALGCSAGVMAGDEELDEPELGSTGSSGSSESTGSTVPTVEPEPEGSTGSAAECGADAVLRDVTIFQVVGIDALIDGEAIAPDDRNAPVVEARAAVVRATVETGAGWVGAELEARIAVTTPGGTETFVDERFVDAESADFEIRLPASVMQAGATYSVSIDCAPAPFVAELAPVPTGVIKLHLVPFEVDGFVPDTSPAVLEGFRQAVLAVYPASDVEITVGEVVADAYSGGLDMGTLLVDLGVIQEQQEPRDVYYYGLATGAATREEYCDCITGSSEGRSGDRAGFAMGAAFADQKSEDTLIHELGHLHGLPHAPCGDPDDVDKSFPYAEAAIGTEGYDSRTESFVPSDHKDMMAYCYPRWISDHNYAKLVDWVQQAQAWQ